MWVALRRSSFALGHQQSTQRRREAVCRLVELTMKGNRRPGSGWGSGAPIGTSS